jgi:hypothetical protein
VHAATALLLMLGAIVRPEVEVETAETAGWVMHGGGTVILTSLQLTSTLSPTARGLRRTATHDPIIFLIISSLMKLAPGMKTNVRFDGRTTCIPLRTAGPGLEIKPLYIAGLQLSEKFQSQCNTSINKYYVHVPTASNSGQRMLVYRSEILSDHLNFSCVDVMLDIILTLTRRNCCVDCDARDALSVNRFTHSVAIQS